MTEEQLQKLLEIKEEVLTESNLKYFPSRERAKEFSNGFLSQISKENLIDIVERFQTKKPALKLYQIDFTPMYPVPSVLVVLAYDEDGAISIASETVKHTGIIGINEIAMDRPKVVVYESGDY